MNTELFSNNGCSASRSIDQADDAVPLAEALLAGGLNCMEVTFRTARRGGRDRAHPQRRSANRHRRGHAALAGQREAGRGRGRAIRRVARLERNGIAKAANKNQLPMFPGVMTPTEVGRAMELGWKHLKFFPAETAGGVKMLKALAGPFAHTGVKFVPTGGINGGHIAGLSGAAASRRHRRFVDGRAQTRRRKSVGQNHRAHGRSDEDDRCRQNDCRWAGEVIPATRTGREIILVSLPLPATILPDALVSIARHRAVSFHQQHAGQLIL